MANLEKLLEQMRLEPANVGFDELKKYAQLTLENRDKVVPATSFSKPPGLATRA